MKYDIYITAFILSGRTFTAHTSTTGRLSEVKLKREGPVDAELRNYSPSLLNHMKKVFSFCFS